MFCGNMVPWRELNQAMGVIFEITSLALGKSKMALSECIMTLSTHLWKNYHYNENGGFPSLEILVQIVHGQKLRGCCGEVVNDCPKIDTKPLAIVILAFSFQDVTRITGYHSCACTGDFRAANAV